MPDINIVTQITDWNVGDILAGSAPGRSARIPGSTSADLKVLAQQGNGKNSAKPFWTSVGSIIPGLAAIATSGSASDLVSGTIPPLRFPALTGDVTTPGGSLATTISLNAVTNAKAAKMPPMTIKGNNSILASDPKDLTVAEVNAMGIGGGGGGSGTVTSVGLSMPAIFSVAGSPVTTVGTFTVTLATELANTVWAGPSAGAAATPTFRALVAADIPSLSSIYQPIDATLSALSALADAVGFLHNDGAGNLAWSAAGSGTVTSVSVVSANGLAGTVATATTTPAITLSTTITGVLKGNGTAISSASAGTDYVAPGAVTSSGLTQATARLLGRTTAGTGAIEEITVGAGLNLSAGVLSATGGGSGDVVGPASATDNAIARFDSTTGKLIQNSTATIDDNGILSVSASTTNDSGIILTSSAINTRLNINNTNSPYNSGIRLLENGVGKWTIASYNTGTFTFYNETIASEAIGITAANAVSISGSLQAQSTFRVGTAGSPTGKAYIYSTGVADNLRMDGNASPGLSIANSGTPIGYWAGVSAAGNFFTDSSVGDQIFRSEGFNILLGSSSNAASSVRILSSGSLGVGITPVAKLHVSGFGTTSGTYSFAVQDSSGANQILIRDDGQISFPSLTLTTGLSITTATKTFPLTINGTLVNVLCQ